MEKLLSRNWFCVGCIIFLTLGVWGRSAGYGFVYDDDILVSQNRAIRSVRNIPGFFWRRDLQSSEAEPSSYRPVRNSVYALLYAADGQETPRPWIFHLNNVLWHAAAAALLFQAALLLWGRLGLTTARRGAALLLALGFAAHPVLCEAVCYVKCLDDLLAGVFVLAALGALLRWNGTGRGYAWALGWFLLASFAKESAAPFAPVVFFVLLGFHRLPWRRCLALTAPFLGVALFYAVTRHCIMGRTTQYAPISGSYGQTLIDMLPVATEYLRLLWGVPPFCADYNYMVSQPPYALFSGAALGGASLIVLTVVLAAGLWRQPEWRLAGFGLGWIGLFLLPVSNLLPMMQYMAERFLYLPLMGFLLALAAAMLKFSAPRLAAAAGAALVVVWAGTSLEHEGIWRDDLTLFVRTELEFPGSPRQEQNAVSAIFHLPQMRPLFPEHEKTGNWQMAKSLTPAQADPIVATLQEARRLFPGMDVFTTELAFVEAKAGRWPEAVEMAEMAARQNPGSATNQFNLAGLSLGAGEPGRARAACAEALRLQPDFAQAKVLQARIEAALEAAPQKASSPGN
jgi:tetratricopeptide (TPR) repeat protein